MPHTNGKNNARRIDIETPRRIVLLGPPGSGKSTLARWLAARHALPVVHLDQVYWQPGWVAAESSAFQAEVERIAALPGWVIDGNYTATIEPRMAAADTLIYLDAPTWLCLLRVMRRMIASFGRVRPDAAPGCPERFDLSFLRFVAGWNRRSRARSLGLVAQFPGRGLVLDGRAPTPRNVEML